MMPYSERCAMASMIIAKAKEFGADLVGFADVGSLKDGPSEQLFPKMKDHSRDHFAERITTGLPHGAVLWEDGAQTAIVYAVAHPEESPEMDWWCGGIDPPGNKKLAAVGKALQNWICETWPDVTVWPKPYHVEKGGIYLKEAAYWAGLGCIGRSNLLITPEFGPKLRLRAMLISEKLPQTGPSGFDPCAGCEEYCLKACPQGAFGEVVYTSEETGLEHLPARRGDYFRKCCVCEMSKNEAEAQVQVLPAFSDEPLKVTKYCRNCEFACPVGRQSK